MSVALYSTEQIRFWNEREIDFREGAITRLVHSVKDPLLALNRSWSFQRVDGALLTPSELLSSSYGPDDVWTTNGLIAGKAACLRAETTTSSYAYAKYLMSQAGGGQRLPLCVWQSGRSFRRESNEGATASNLRFFEFYQLEFQCIYSVTTKADYRTPTLASVEAEIGAITGLKTRVVPSDRLPTYSEETLDIEVEYGDKWREMASVSIRTDFGADYKVLEVAVGLDRLVMVGL